MDIKELFKLWEDLFCTNDPRYSFTELEKLAPKNKYPTFSFLWWNEYGYGTKKVTKTGLPVKYVKRGYAVK
jgi:hypothetical protein